MDLMINLGRMVFKHELGTNQFYAHITLFEGSSYLVTVDGPMDEVKMIMDMKMKRNSAVKLYDPDFKKTSVVYIYKEFV